eukprot:GILK01011662.1.p1 GENE.GILK01011662.1~~GILK01011662.1.p1  ORF type:complete len:401 (-),score=68.45 GILK01011662.1:257-1459(-)
MAEYTVPIMLALTPKHCILVPLFGMSFERAIKWHKWLGYLVVVEVTIHMVGIMADWIQRDMLWTSLFHSRGDFVLYGLIAASSLYMMYIFSLEYFRRSYFWLFYRCHWIFGIIFFVFSILHMKPLKYIVNLAVPVGLWALDWIYRAWTLRTATVTEVRRLSSEYIKLTLRVPDFEFEPGQYVFIHSLKLALFQFHPFSIASCPSQPQSITLYIRTVGPWTQAVTTGPNRLLVGDKVQLDGPFGKVSLPVDRYRTLLIICGGVGVSPFLSVLHHLHLTDIEDRFESITFVLATRQASLIEELIPVLSRLSHGTCALNIQLYLTQQAELPLELTSAIPKAEFFCRRPDISKIFLQVRLSSSSKRVAVLTCGPTELTEEVTRVAHRLSDSRKRFDVHAETFLL